MKAFSILLIAILTSFILKAQDITGQWNGVLKVQGIQLRLLINIIKTDNGYSSTMDSPDQGANGIPVTNTTFENPKIKFEVTFLRIEYIGELKENEIIGTFKQGGQEFPMNLSRKVIDKVTLKQPQEPTEPFPYYSEDITFQNTKANISLSGTLTLPKKEGNFPYGNSFQRSIIWHTWDKGCKFEKMEGKFEKGNHFTFRPKGEPNVKIKLLEVVENKSFLDVTKFPLAKMYDNHQFEETANGLKITHTITVKGILGFLWVKIVAQKLADELPTDMQEQIKAASKL